MDENLPSQPADDAAAESVEPKQAPTPFEKLRQLRRQRAAESMQRLRAGGQNFAKFAGGANSEAIREKLRQEAQKRDYGVTPIFTPSELRSMLNLSEQGYARPYPAGTMYENLTETYATVANGALTINEAGETMIDRKALTPERQYALRLIESAAKLTGTLADAAPEYELPVTVGFLIGTAANRINTRLERDLDVRPEMEPSAAYTTEREYLVNGLCIALMTYEDIVR